MSVRVNLLPQETFARQEATRQRGIAAIAGVVLLVLLGLLYWFQMTRIDDARNELAAEEETLAELNRELANLQEFEALEERIERDEQMIATAMSHEASLAAILQDVAAVMPTDAQFESLAIALNTSDPGGGIERPSWGTLTAQGSSLTSHAPGLERLLLQFDKIAAFHDLFFTNSSLDDPEDEIVSFTVEAELGPEILTNRYQDGVPEELR